MSQLEFDLGDAEQTAAPVRLMPEHQELLVTLMADALLAVLKEVPEPETQEKRKDDDE